jgi:hypothetical protein
MKKIGKIAVLLCIVVLLNNSCKKDKGTKQKQKYDVNFDVSGFSQASGGFGTTSVKKEVNSLNTNALADQLDVLIAIIYEGNPTTSGTKIYKSTHLLTDPNAARFTASLPPGNYTAVIYGGKGITEVEGDPVNDPDAFNTTVKPWNDVFYKKLPFTIAGAVLNQSVVLDRITAQLQIKLQDNIQASWQKITVSYPDYTYLQNLTLTSPYGFARTAFNLTKTFAATDVGATNYTIVLETANNGEPFTVMLTLYDTGNNVISTRTIDNVICERNKRTILTGKVYSNSTGFTIAVDTAWHSPIPKTF